MLLSPLPAITAPGHAHKGMSSPNFHPFVISLGPPLRSPSPLPGHLSSHPPPSCLSHQFAAQDCCLLTSSLFLYHFLPPPTGVTGSQVSQEVTEETC